jgi:hypothetical protein
MSLTKEAERKIEELLNKAQHDGLLTSAKALCQLLEEQGLMYEVRVHSKYVGVHPLNRDGCGVSSKGVQDLITNVSHIGWDWAAVKALAVEVDSSTLGEVLAFNRHLVSSSQGVLAPIEEPIRFVSLEGSHTNQALRAFHYQCPHPSDVLTEGGKLSIHKLMARDSAFADAVVNGLNWKVIAASALVRFPTMAFVLQAAGNAAGQVSQGESELQLLRRVHSAWKIEHAVSASAVDFGKVKSRVLASSQTHAECVPYLYAFVLKFCGGHGAELLSESEAYIRHNSVATKRLGQAFFQALSLDTRGQAADMNARVRHALLKLAYTPDETVSKNDISRLVQSTDKSLQAKVKEADHILTDMRAYLKSHNVLEQCLNLVHKFDMDAVRFLLGRRLGRKYLSVAGIAHDFLLDVRTSTGVDVPLKFETEAGLTTDFPTPSEPQASAGSKKSQTIQMCELDGNAQLSNITELLNARGISTGGHIRNKADGSTAVIKSMDQTSGKALIELPDLSQSSLQLDDLLNGQWIVFKPKTAPQQMDVSGYQGLDTSEYELHVLRAKVVVAIDDVLQLHAGVQNSLKILSKPRRVEVLKNFTKGSCVIVPCSTKLVSKECSIDEIPSGALALGELTPGLQFWLAQQTTLPTADKPAGFVSAFWFIETTSEKDEVNVEQMFVKPSSFPLLKIPIYKNSKPLKAGDVLKVLDSNDKDTAGEPVVSEQKGKKRKTV